MDVIIGNFSGGLNYYGHSSTPEVISAIPGIRKKQEDFLMVYPNPANDYVRIEVCSSFPPKDLSLKIINLMGEIIVEKSFHRQLIINTERFQPGLYIIRTGEFSGKLFIRH